MAFASVAAGAQMRESAFKQAIDEGRAETTAEGRVRQAFEVRERHLQDEAMAMYALAPRYGSGSVPFTELQRMRQRIEEAREGRTHRRLQEKALLARRRDSAARQRSWAALDRTKSRRAMAADAGDTGAVAELRDARRRHQSGHARTLPELQAQALARAGKPSPWAADGGVDGDNSAPDPLSTAGLPTEVQPLEGEELDDAREVIAGMRRRRNLGLPLNGGTQARARIAGIAHEAVKRRAHRRQRDRRRAMLAERRMAARAHGVEHLFASSSEEDAESLASTSEEEEDRLEGVLARKAAAQVLGNLEEE